MSHISPELGSSGIKLKFTAWEVLPFGEFKVQKNYYVPTSSCEILSSRKLSCGNVIQIIRKQTRIIDRGGKIYSTSEKISEYTSRNVKFSNDDYVEIFQIGRDKHSKHDDAFQNGALTKYDKRKTPYIWDSIHDDDRLPYLTEGRIVVNGKNYYLPPKIYEGFAEQFKPRPDVSGPANGLLTVPLTKDVEDWLNDNAPSVPLVHTVKVEWNENRTLLYNYINNKESNKLFVNHYKDLEGGRIKHNKHKSKLINTKNSKNNSNKKTKPKKVNNKKSKLNNEISNKSKLNNKVSNKTKPKKVNNKKTKLNNKISNKTKLNNKVNNKKTNNI
tara:strand:- start:2691 stop:3677 length:987 start_codon:yes stop_codon:yes gene_type:complete